MTSTLPLEHSTIHNLVAQMSTSQLTRRTSGTPTATRSSRVEKPRSNHNSPRVLERRKTMVGAKRYATLDDHFNMMYGIEGDEEPEEERREQARPYSWHPSSSYFHMPSWSTASTQQDWPYQHPASSRNSIHRDDFYSLSARNSVYHPQDYTTYIPSHDSYRGSQDSDSSWQTSAYTMSSLSTPATEPMPWYLQEWARKNQASLGNSATGSSDFLPIQHSPAVLTEDVEMEGGKELVGMGLYDSPEPAFSCNISNTSILVEGTGKGLKLEETWQPPEETDDEEGDDASSDDGSVDELPAAKEITQLPVAASAKPNNPTNMDGQSFFFDEEESYTKEWWFQQLRQPTLPAREAGLGYGWL